MQKIVNRRTSEKSNLCVVFSSEESEIYKLSEGDIITVEIIKINQKGGKK